MPPFRVFLEKAFTGYESAPLSPSSASSKVAFATRRDPGGQIQMYKPSLGRDESSVAGIRARPQRRENPSQMSGHAHCGLGAGLNDLTFLAQLSGPKGKWCGQKTWGDGVGGAWRERNPPLPTF